MCIKLHLIMGVLMKIEKKELPKKDTIGIEMVDAGMILVRKKCWYFNWGYCKYTSKCHFSHPREICQTYLEGYNCNQRECEKRHPKSCKWIEGSRSCKRQDCAYLPILSFQRIYTTILKKQISNVKGVQRFGINKSLL